MQVDLTLRDAIRLKGLLEASITALRHVNAENYPHRAEDEKLMEKLVQPSDAHWNK